MNYTQVPNWIFDQIPNWPNAMTKIVLVVARQTYGYHREFDEISISQFQTWTGLSRQGVVASIQQAVKLGVVRKIKTDEGCKYGLIEPVQAVNSVDQTSQESGLPLVNSVDQQEQGVVNSVDQTSQLSRPELVNSVDPQNKEKEILKKVSTPLPPKQEPVGGGGDQTPESLSEQARQPAKPNFYPESYQLLVQAGCVATGLMQQAAALPPERIAALIESITRSGGRAGAIIRAALNELALPPELKYQEKSYAVPQRTMGPGRGRAPEAQQLSTDRPQRSELSQAELDELDLVEQRERQRYAAEVAARNAQRQQRQSQSGSHM